jgi:hypothetical protein
LPLNFDTFKGIMPVEPEPNNSIEQGVEPFAEEMAQIQALWQELPDAHQVSLVLQLADSIMSGVYRPYLRNAMTQQWPVRPAELPVAFPKLVITEDDLLNGYLDEEDAAHLTEEHRNQIAETMRNHYIHDLFWPELRHVAGLVLEKLANGGEST